MDNLRCVRETPPHVRSGAGRASHAENASRLTGAVERITYQNAENGFSVIKCRAKGYSDLVTVVGNMQDVHVGSVLSMQGQWKIDGKYGRQFSAEKWEETLRLQLTESRSIWAAV